MANGACSRFTVYHQTSPVALKGSDLALKITMVQSNFYRIP
jgi:hypothetical protein